MIVLFFGAPGVGKGTQSVLFAEKMKIGHLSTGDAFRKAISQQTEVGLLAKSYVDSGGLVPDEIVTKIVEEALSAPEFADGVILDGFPRTIAQADGLTALLEKNGKKVTHVVNLTAPYDEITERMMKRGRKDDTEEIIRHRLQIYENETAPLLEYYQKFEGVVHNVDGFADVDTVHGRILSVFS